MKEKDPNNELIVIRVNSILSNNETKILSKLIESLKLKQSTSSFQSIEMMKTIEQYFVDNRNNSVLFILEDVDFYVQNTKQILLYKILDMFQHA